MRNKKVSVSDIDAFIALPDWKKNEIFEEIEAETPEQRLANSRPLNARERAQWLAFKKRSAQVRKESDAVQKISISVEQSLLKRADRYAKRHKLNRSEMFAKGLRSLIKE